MKKLFNYAGFDIGGTHTNYYIENEDKKLIDHGFRDGLNFSSTNKDEIFDFLEQLFQDVLIEDNDYKVYCAVAGLVDAHLKKELKSRFTSDQFEVSFDDDISLFLEQLPENKNNAFMILGTGSILVIKNSKNQIYKIGGWGREFDSFNAAYSFGQAFIRDLIVDIETSSKRFTGLNETLLSEKSIRKLLFMKSNYREIAGYANYLILLCENGNKHALKIFNDVFVKLEHRIDRIKKSDCEMLYLYGGLLKNSYFNSRFIKLLSEYKLDYKLIDTAAEKVACQIARRNANAS